jgi:hypothetical protein
MSITLKRPMFRKGGEVMEGIMTGIKSRESFAEKGVSDDMRDQIKNVQNRMNLIDAVSGAGASPLANPLTQFLLQTGANLIGGTAAGGTKLQEIVGATQQPLQTAIKTQQAKDISRRKLATALLSKMGGSDVAKLQRNAKQLSKLLNIPIEEATQMEINRTYFKDPTSLAEQRRKDTATFVKGLMSETDSAGRKLYKTAEANAIGNARASALQNPKLKNRLDASKIAVGTRKDIKKFEETTTELGEKKVKAFRPEDIFDFQENNVYYDFTRGTWMLFKNGLLIPIGQK